MSFCGHKKGAFVDNFIVSKIIELKFDAAIFIRAIGDFGLGWLDHIFFPLKNVYQHFSRIFFVVSQVEIQYECDYAVVDIYVKLLDCVDGADAIHEMCFWTEHHLFFIFAKDYIQFGLPQLD